MCFVCCVVVPGLVAASGEDGGQSAAVQQPTTNPQNLDTKQHSTTQSTPQYTTHAKSNQQGMELAVPGTYIAGEPLVTIAAFAPQLQVIASKQRPRKLTVHGGDGAEYMFLLKGHEDLRQDERVMQLFGLVNSMLAAGEAVGRVDWCFFGCWGLSCLRLFGVGLVEVVCGPQYSPPSFLDHNNNKQTSKPQPTTTTSINNAQPTITTFYPSQQTARPPSATSRSRATPSSRCRPTAASSAGCPTATPCTRSSASTGEGEGSRGEREMKGEERRARREKGDHVAVSGG